ncbi:MAG TPA: bifunctional 4-hydroxy-2-oxoglutarate aldolase/2-dehydro-3-deoxy-phosphogluconate aldolase [Bacteroidales bacterium]|nr:bifunctional 4-hydroxy-2-oxoglutarate aldolase/2-dehydro-3-deoxy-phosphogluconate aldolase [Bacteroidales bacterium]
MARFTRINVAFKMQEQGMIPVLYHPDVQVMKEVLKACYIGGGRLFEFTNRGDFAHEVFAEINKWAATELPEMILGVGSVVDAGTASLYIQLGTAFVVSPVLKEDMALTCNRRKILWMPGCGTLTEISRAEELGAEIVKIFPGSAVGGPKFVKAILGPSPWSSIMPTGDVDSTEDNLKAWFGAGVKCVGMGSKLISKELVNQKDWKAIEQNVKNTLARIRNIRGQ